MSEANRRKPHHRGARGQRPQPKTGAEAAFAQWAAAKAPTLAHGAASGPSSTAPAPAAPGFAPPAPTAAARGTGSTFAIHNASPASISRGRAADAVASGAFKDPQAAELFRTHARTSSDAAAAQQHPGQQAAAATTSNACFPAAPGPFARQAQHQRSRTQSPPTLHNTGAAPPAPAVTPPFSFTTGVVGGRDTTATTGGMPRLDLGSSALVGGFAAADNSSGRSTPGGDPAWRCSSCTKVKQLCGPHLAGKTTVRSDCWPCGKKRVFRLEGGAAVESSSSPRDGAGATTTTAAAASNSASPMVANPPSGPFTSGALHTATAGFRSMSASSGDTMRIAGSSMSPPRTGNTGQVPQFAAQDSDTGGSSGPHTRVPTDAGAASGGGLTTRPRAASLSVVPGFAADDFLARVLKHHRRMLLSRDSVAPTVRSISPSAGEGPRTMHLLELRAADDAVVHTPVTDVKGLAAVATRLGFAVLDAIAKARRRGPTVTAPSAGPGGAAAPALVESNAVTVFCNTHDQLAALAAFFELTDPRSDDDDDEHEAGGAEQRRSYGEAVADDEDEPRRAYPPINLLGPAADPTVARGFATSVVEMLQSRQRSPRSEGARAPECAAPVTHDERLRGVRTIAHRCNGLLVMPIGVVGFSLAQRAHAAWAATGAPVPAQSVVVLGRTPRWEDLATLVTQVDTLVKPTAAA